MIPVNKPWESSYANIANFANIQIYYSDPKDLVAINGHEQQVKDGFPTLPSDFVRPK